MAREALIIYFFHENNCPLALRYMARETLIILTVTVLILEVLNMYVNLQ